MAADDSDLGEPALRARLPLMKSPVVDSTDNRDKAGPVHQDRFNEPPTLQGGFVSFQGERVGLPIFRKFEDASLLELFTDLFFAANYTVFTQTQKVVGKKTLAAYVGYFCTLWVTWLLITLYDVRYLTDCVFERLTRAVHLGVLVGFAVVAPKFEPHDQDRTTMRIMSVILAVSRFCLGVEYLGTLWHCRNFTKARLPIAVQSGFFFALSLIYLGITFRFREDHNSRVFITWYILAASELAFTLGLSIFSQVLTFVRTHLMKRLSLLTVITLGDGIIVMAQDMVKMVQHSHGWDSLTLGLFTSCAVMIYCVFLVYFDWMRETHLTRWRQMGWVTVHLPYHLALVLFMHGFSQLILYTTVINALPDVQLESANLFNTTWVAAQNSSEIAAEFSNAIAPFFDDYRTSAFSFFTMQTALANLTSIPNDFWSKHPTVFNDTSTAMAIPEGHRGTVYYSVTSVYLAMINAVFDSYGIKIMDEVVHEDTADDLLTIAPQVKTFRKTIGRYGLVFAYGYICSGITLIMLVVLTVISRKQRWTPWPAIRSIFNAFLGLGMAAISTIWFAQEEMGDFLTSGWAIPTITLFWFLVLVLTHVGSGAHAVKRMAFGERARDSQEARSHFWPAELDVKALSRRHSGRTYRHLYTKKIRGESTSKREVQRAGADDFEMNDRGSVGSNLLQSSRIKRQ